MPLIPCICYTFSSNVTVEMEGGRDSSIKPPKSCHLRHKGEQGVTRNHTIRTKLQRSKSKVEGHVCHPWLRRLFFHMSHYFPNLHTQRPRTRSADSKFKTVKKSHSIERNLTNYGGRSPSPQAQRSTNVSNKINTHQDYLNSQIKKELPSIIPTSSSKASKQIDIFVAKNKRRPLQRQNSSGIVELEEYYKMITNNREVDFW